PVVAAAPGPKEPKKGQKLSGKIAQIGDNGVFVSFGGRAEAVLDVAEIRGEDGNPTKAVGDDITATVVSVGETVKLTLKGKKTGDIAGLLDAQKSGTPVEGKVTGVNKGGLVVRTLGVRAFCPFSQIDRRYIDNPQEYVGKTLTFVVTTADDKGRNVVLSRRSLLEEEAKGQAEELRQKLEIGQEMSGIVARIRPFGAFVDLGGVDGMVHVSEISHARVNDPNSVLKVGQEVKVRVVKVEDLGGSSERISLSMKQLESDPWETAVDKLTVGEQLEGKVVRVVDFGAFVEISPGVDGLVHVSALAPGRVEHPSEVVSPGDAVTAWVTQLDADKRRISLSLVDPSERSERTPRFDRGDRPPRRRGESNRPPKVHRSGDPSDGLTSMGEAFQRLREQMGE
ncbi:MAG: S1 RNA-binding domain-containing protein, partial [Gemmatimonadetes bacterium]|nr:S1 RNA-binding domain-containing protein [Gemmatimonadota bacterium]